jgi:hypothetical protein
MKVLLIERDKTDVPTIVESLDVRYSKKRGRLVIDGFYRWYEVDVSIERAKDIVDAYISDTEGMLDLRGFPATGFYKRD